MKKQAILFNKRITVLAAVLGILFVIFTYGSLIYPHSWFQPSGGSLEPPSVTHILGTDDLGIDIFAQLSRGFFTSIMIGLMAAAIAFTLGGVLGGLAGYFEGWVDESISFVINLFLAIPQLPIMIVMGAFFGPSIVNVVLIVALFSWAPIAKIVRAKMVERIDSNYIRLAKSYGGGFFYIVKTHLLPDILPVLSVNAIAVIGKAIVQEASLAFLGLSDPLSKSWGLMMNKAINFKGIYFMDAWIWWLLPPLFCLMGMILCIRLISREIENQLIND